MFYQFSDDITTVDALKTDAHYVTAGYVTSGKFDRISKSMGVSFISETSLACGGSFACYVKKNLFLVVGINDEDCFVRDCFLNCIKRYESINVNLGKIVFAFFDEIIKNDGVHLKKAEEKINRLEELVLTDKADKSFNYILLKLKKELLSFKNYYANLLETAEELIENESEVFDFDDLKYLRSLSEKIKRQKENVETLRNSIVHLQEAYSSYLDLKLNQTMKVFTALTTVFFPLTVIVGWYGMNFSSMPEITWKYGYLFVIILSVVVVAGLLVIIKKRKWL